MRASNTQATGQAQAAACFPGGDGPDTGGARPVCVRNYAYLRSASSVRDVLGSEWLAKSQ